MYKLLPELNEDDITQKQWRDSRHLLPQDDPKSPWSVYEEWTNWNDFLGTKPINQESRIFVI